MQEPKTNVRRMTTATLLVGALVSLLSVTAAADGPEPTPIPPQECIDATPTSYPGDIDACYSVPACFVWIDVEIYCPVKLQTGYFVNICE